LIVRAIAQRRPARRASTDEVTSSVRPELYTDPGVRWGNDNGPDGVVMETGERNGHRDPVSRFERVLLRTMPELVSGLRHVVNAFDPWARDQGEYDSLGWRPRPGAEADPSFG
jgi:hypothetical protein